MPCTVGHRAQHSGAQVVVGPALDLESLASVRSFAAAWEASKRPLHVLVNNAGANYLVESYTPEGVARLAQVGTAIINGYVCLFGLNP